MHLLNRQLGIVAPILVGIFAFGLTAAAITVASAEAAPDTHATYEASPTSSAPPEPVLEVPIGEVTAIGDGQEISLPIDAYRASPASQNIVLLAEYVTMKACMARYGIGFEPPVESWTVPTVNHDYDRLFGLIDLDEAQQFGYHTGEQLLASGESMSALVPLRDPNDSTPYYLTVALGDPAAPKVNGLVVPDGGCIGEARAALGDSGAAQALYENAVNYGLYQSDADPRVVRAFASWSDCMEDAGYSYSTPMAAVDAPEWATLTPSEVEIDVATADVNCKNFTNLTGLRVAVATAWQEQYIRDHAADFAAMRSETEDQVAKANAILD